jgi:hypothetical protein
MAETVEKKKVINRLKACGGSASRHPGHDRRRERMYRYRDPAKRSAFEY